MDDIFDLNKENTLTREQMGLFISTNLQIELKRKELFSLLQIFDVNKDGTINRAECRNILKAGESQLVKAQENLFEENYDNQEGDQAFAPEP